MEDKGSQLAGRAFSFLSILCLFVCPGVLFFYLVVEPDSKNHENETVFFQDVVLPTRSRILDVTDPLFPEVGVIALTTDAWRVQWMHSRHHFLPKLTKYYPVVWVEPSVHWRTIFDGKTPRPPVFERSTDYPGLTIYRQELYLPHFFGLKRITEAFLKVRVSRAAAYLRDKGCKKLVLYLWNPRFGAALDSRRWDLTCYHIDDEYSFSAVDLPNSPEEVDILKHVDQVFIHSEMLLEKKGSINPHSMLIPNGVNYSWFASSSPEPADLANIPHPWIGYTGFVKKQLDWDLLRSLSARHPEWSFVFIGQVSPHPEIVSALKEMEARKNVFFLGPKPVPVAATYPQHFDVCIMPYVMNDYTKYIYPLKLHEYLAGGKPTVSTPLPAVCPFSNVVRLARTEQEWSEAISASLAPESDGGIWKRIRQSVAKEHDWDVLVEKVAQTFSARLGLADSRWPRADSEKTGS